MQEDMLAMAPQLMRQSLRRRLLLWVVRWAIGFGIIAAIVRYRPDALWLWWAGAAVAGASFLLTVVMHFVLQRRIARAIDNINADGGEAAAFDGEAHV